jgi:tRNA threonylcarbamoyladenosine biosynthesis protein TsaE
MKYVNIEKMEYISNSTDETQKIAEDFLSEINPNQNSAFVVGLYGNLGAGKTAFTKCIAKSLGVPDTVNSPTFVIEKIYELSNKKFRHLIHIDAYRLEKSDELLKLGWQTILSDPNNLILIEWPEKVSNIMPQHTKINFQHRGDDSRKIEIQ